MPMFHFHVSDGQPSVEEASIELEDEAAARVMGARHLAEIISEQARRMGPHSIWRVMVKDADRTVLFTFEATINDGTIATNH